MQRCYSRGLLTVLDLLYYLPFRYEDRSNANSSWVSAG